VKNINIIHLHPVYSSAQQQRSDIDDDDVDDDDDGSEVNKCER
jgi:hypothetical protein